MKTIHFFTFLLVGCFVFQPALKAQQSEIQLKMQSLKEAVLKKDSLALVQLLAEDVSYGHSNGLVQTRSQFISSVMNGEQDYRAIENSDLEVRIYDSAAIVTMQSKVQMFYLEKPLDLNMKILMVWIRKKGGWQLEGRQSVSITK